MDDIPTYQETGYNRGSSIAVQNSGEDESGNLLDGNRPDHRSAQGNIYSLWADVKNLFLLRKGERQGIVKDSTSNAYYPPWKPAALRTPIIATLVLVSLALIAVLQYLLTQSQRNNGILFASNVNDLPLGKQFAYLYLPTILAVLYSILWSWIDLDAKRLEPYNQLSKPEGALGKDSLLLHYPFDFIATVPLKSIKRRHWPVFWASSATVLVFWGLTPFQAGIFATETVTKTVTVPGLVSTSFLPLSQQETTVTANYTYSVYGIMWLNESLPQFMSHEYALAPFKPAGLLPGEEAIAGNLTIATSLYSLDMNCEVPGNGFDGDRPVYTGKAGCKVDRPYALTGNETVSNDPSQGSITNGEFTAVYAGFNNEDGFADWYISPWCPSNASHVFWAGFTRNKKAASDQSETPTVLYCEPWYYSQDVNATVAFPSMAVVSSVPTGPKTALPSDTFNTSNFEWQLNSHTQRSKVRGEIPAISWPQGIVAFALGAGTGPLEQYLDPVVWGKAWESAYRLLFARSMVDVLGQSYERSETRVSEFRYQTQAVVLVPAFTYMAQALLATVSLLAVAVLYLSLAKRPTLRSDPATIAAMMSMVADNEELLNSFGDLDSSMDTQLHTTMKDNSFKLESDGQRIVLLHIPTDRSYDSCNCLGNASHASNKGKVSKTTRPLEFRSWAATFFLLLNASMLITIVLLHKKSQPRGLPLPSRYRFINQLLESYVPTVLATLIEPIWVVLNRLICLMQPFETLRKARSAADRTISLDYTSVPPQLVIFRALRAHHYTLALVCVMALLANVLAVALSGLFYEDIITVPHPLNLGRPYKSFITDGTMTYTDQYLMASSNITSGTVLPPWTDSEFFYLPFSPSAATNASYQASTRAFGARLSCFSLLPETADNRTVTLDAGNGTTVKCAATIPLFNAQTYPDCSGVPQAAENLGWLVQAEFSLYNNTHDQTDSCQQWILASWSRSPGHGLCATGGIVSPAHTNIMACRPVLLTGVSDVVVDAAGCVQTATHSISDSSSVEGSLNYNSDRVISQVNKIFADRAFVGQAVGVQRGDWHNDSFPSDYVNYFMVKLSGSDRLLNPSSSLPQINDTAPLLSKVYARIFALNLGYNIQQLLQPSDDPEASPLPGFGIRQETRILLSKPMFCIAVAILSTYIIVGIIVHVRRPGRFLPRMPTTIASVIAFFAASHAVQDLKGTAQMSKKERDQCVEKLDRKYGYGSFVGTDGKVHVGIERQPYLGHTRRDAVDGAESRKRRVLLSTFGWRDGEIREGGWI